MIFDPLLERLLAYNDSAVTVWNAIKNGASIESVSTVLAKTYGISAEQSSKDATLVIQHWAESNLLEGATVAPFRAAAAPLISAAADLTFKPDIGPGRSVFYRINEYCFRTTIFERSIAQGLERLLRSFAIDADGPAPEFTAEPASGGYLMVCIDGVEQI